MIYLDNNATTRPNASMVNYVAKEIFQSYGNASSLHLAGIDSASLMDESRKKVARSIGAKESEIIFTSGGTESNNIALNDPSSKYVKIISCVEHSSISNQSHDFSISVDKNGEIDLEELEDRVKLNPKSIVSIMLSNNETGVILDPHSEILRLKEKYGFIYHVDAVQGFSKIDLDMSSMEIDLLSISSHKIHGLKGSGALFISRRLEKESYPHKFLCGGSQEFGYRAGTENQAGILSLGFMCDLIENDISYKEAMRKVSCNRDYFEELLSDISIVNGRNRVGNTSNLYFYGIEDTDLLLEVLSSNGLCASAKSACSSGVSLPSKTLVAMYGDNDRRVHGSIRFSLSVNNTISEIENAAKIVRKSVAECN